MLVESEHAKQRISRSKISAPSVWTQRAAITKHENVLYERMESENRIKNARLESACQALWSSLKLRKIIDAK